MSRQQDSLLKLLSVFATHQAALYTLSFTIASTYTFQTITTDYDNTDVADCDSWQTFALLKFEHVKAVLV